MEAVQFLKAMPKVELHAHLGGSCPRNKLIQLLERHGHNEFTDNIRHPKFEFGNWFQSLFYPTALVMRTKQGLREYVNAVLETFAQDNVVYLELRTTPRSGDDYSLVEYLNIIIQESLKYKDRMKVKLIASLNRDIKDYSIYLTLLEDIQKVDNWKDNIVGLDFSGNPASRTFEEFIPIFQEGRKLGLSMSIHTGEVAGQVSETKAILSLSPQRVGHFSYYTAQQLQQVIDKGIVIEVCISSNVITKGLKSMMDHHIVEFHDKKVKHCICSDDILLFQKSVSDEFQNYSNILKLGDQDCFQLSKESVNYIFGKSQKGFINKKFDEFIESHAQKYPFLKKYN